MVASPDMQPSFLLWIQLKKNNIGFAQHGPYFYITSMKQSRCFLFNDQRHSNHFPEEKLFYSHEGWYQSFQLVILRTAAARGPCCKHQVQMTALTENMGNIFSPFLTFLLAMLQYLKDKYSDYCKMYLWLMPYIIYQRDDHH